MKIPTQCPVCGANHIQSIERQSLEPAGMASTAGALAFRCGQGHTFLMTEAESEAGGAGGEVQDRGAATR